MKKKVTLGGCFFIYFIRKNQTIINWQTLSKSITYLFFIKTLECLRAIGLYLKIIHFSPFITHLITTQRYFFVKPYFKNLQNFKFFIYTIYTPKTISKYSVTSCNSFVKN